MDNLTAILVNTYTIAQLKHRLVELKAYLNQQIFGGSPIMASEWMKSLPEGFFQKFNKDNLLDELQKLEDQISKLQPLTIYLTFDPDETAINQLGQHTRKIFNSLLILDIKYDPNLIGGAALVFRGIYKDYSLRSRIEEKKQLILKSFQSFLG